MIERVKELDRYQVRQFWCLFDDRKAPGLPDGGAFCSPWRFSAGLGRASRCAQTWQQFADPATHLLWGRRTLVVFPRTQFRFDHRTSQNQLIVGHGHDQAPALKLLWGAQPRFLPQQCLLVKAVAMVLAKGADVSQGDGGQIHRGIANPDKPADARIAFGVAGMRAHDSQDRQFQPARLLDMDLLPPTDSHWTTFGILALPRPIRIAMTALIIWLQFGAVFAGRAAFAALGRRRAVETAVAFEADQRAGDRQGRALAPQPDRVVAPIQHYPRFLGQGRTEVPQF